MILVHFWTVFIKYVYKKQMGVRLEIKRASNQWGYHFNKLFPVFPTR